MIVSSSFILNVILVILMCVQVSCFDCSFIHFVYNVSPDLQSLNNRSRFGSRVGPVMALTCHQCGPGWIPGLNVICGLSLLVLYSAAKGFLRLLRFFHLTEN